MDSGASYFILIALPDKDPSDFIEIISTIRPRRNVSTGFKKMHPFGCLGANLMMIKLFSRIQLREGVICVCIQRQGKLQSNLDSSPRLSLMGWGQVTSIQWAIIGHKRLVAIQWQSHPISEHRVGAGPGDFETIPLVPLGRAMPIVVNDLLGEWP